MLDEFEGFIFDLDGTIYVSDQLIEGADEVIQCLKKKKKKILFLTNKTIESREKYVEKLNRLGINVTLEHILSPTLVTIRYLHEHYDRSIKLYVIGEPLIKNELKQAGFQFADVPEETDVIVVSWDREFHYSHLNFAYQAIKRGAKVIATNPDRTCPVQGGDVPDCGGMIGAIEGVTGRKIETIIGKPSIHIGEEALRRLDLPAERCLMVGDRLETDILLGKKVGMKAALVLTGISKKEQIPYAEYQPDYVLDSVYDLIGKNKMTQK